jgi:hypothetical protein
LLGFLDISADRASKYIYLTGEILAAVVKQRDMNQYEIFSFPHIHTKCWFMQFRIHIPYIYAEFIFKFNFYIITSNFIELPFSMKIKFKKTKQTFKNYPTHRIF